MQNSMTENKENQTLTAEDVIEWLRNNPEFLNKFPEAVDILSPPKEHAGKGVVDFQQFMVRRLREDRDGIIEEAREIVETSRANMSNQARTHQAVLMLLDARTFEDFIHTLTMDIAALLDLDIISLIVEAEGEVIPHINLPGVRVVSEGSIELLLQDKTSLLEADTKGIEEIYGGGAGLVRSQALLRLNIASAAPPAMLALGSREPLMYQPGQGTELLSFLGHVTERSFRKWLDLPPHL